VRATLVLLLTTLAFVASLLVVPPPVAHARTKDDAAIGTLSRLATVHVAKPAIRKAERTPGPALAPRVFVAEPAALVLVAAKAPPKQFRPSAPDRSLFMVFLN
jgi:hypothetical protein